MLYLIGLGLDLKDISLKALEAIKKCSKLYLEIYTTFLPYKKAELEKTIGKKVAIAVRETVENKSREFVKEAKKRNVALLVYGDPLAATTHISLLQEAKKAKVNVKVLHNSSIFNAISETGLQLYKFGKTASIPKWHKSYEPTSFFDIVKDNLKINAHTLLLVDIDLSFNEALHELEKASKGKVDNIIVCSRLGTDEQYIVYSTLKELIKNKKIHPKIKEPFCFIIPATLHFTEAEFLELLIK
ncbi:MAG: diphthine synthase [Candidatus Pacearchaeota archaeon]|nr:diphthine synthase [Candidatus Pacearchaeota archaeon]